LQEPADRGAGADTGQKQEGDAGREEQARAAGALAAAGEPKHGGPEAANLVSDRTDRQEVCSYD